jgi:hypothetical protein
MRMYYLYTLYRRAGFGVRYAIGRAIGIAPQYLPVLALAVLATACNAPTAPAPAPTATATIPQAPAPAPTAPAFALPASGITATYGTLLLHVCPTMPRVYYTANGVPLPAVVDHYAQTMPGGAYRLA